MNRTEDDALLREEVRELTGLLRNDPSWGDLRAVLGSQHLDSREVLLVSFLEDEVENEYGVFIRVVDRRVFEYERSTSALAEARFSVWRELLPGQDAIGKYPQVAEALRMLEEGVLS